MRMNFSIKTREVLKFIFFSLCCYGVFIFGFAYLYYMTDSIEMTPYSKPVVDRMDFWKAVYFSIVSFHTIGFGDIHPITDQGRQIVMIQSTISLFFTAIFSGFLVYFVIRRPNDIFSTKKIYIRYRRDHYWLSIRLGNKGRTIIDMKSKFETWTIADNSRVRAFQTELEVADLERILYFDIDLDDPDNIKLRQSILKAMRQDILLHMKFSVIGNDIKTGEQVAFAKYYDSRDIRFGKTFLNVYSWDTSGHRKDFRWKNFEKIEDMEIERILAFTEESQI
jgi:hypothetical protein